MRILDTYYRAGAPNAVAVSMSEACRSSTLTYKASSVYIFDTARREMLHRMGIVLEVRESVSSRLLWSWWSPSPRYMLMSQTSSIVICPLRFIGVHVLQSSTSFKYPGVLILAQNDLRLKCTPGYFRT